MSSSTTSRDVLLEVPSSVEHEARIVGLKGFSTPTLEAVDRRRAQLWTVAFAGLVALSAAVALLTSEGAHRLGFANRAGFRVGTVVLVLGLAGYVVEKERHLRRLSTLLVDERVLAAGLSNRLKELAVLYEAGKAMNSVLVIEEVLELILASAFELLGAASGSIALVDETGALRQVCKAGHEFSAFELTEGIARRVVADMEPLLVHGKVMEKGRVDLQSTVCVPLIHRDQVLGVLSLSGSPDHPYTEHDLRAVSLFAEHAAIAVANARLYEAERNLSAKLSHQTVHDSLTGAANRILVEEKLTEALARLEHQRGSVAVLFIDIDDFKLVNDELGHGAGDMVLSTVAKRLSGCVGPLDTVGRIGGDEFVVVCGNVGLEETPEMIGNRVLRSLCRPFSTPFGERLLTASIGVSSCDWRDVRGSQELIHTADAAMYRAKMSGKARVASVPVVDATGPVHDRGTGSAWALHRDVEGGAQQGF